MVRLLPAYLAYGILKRFVSFPRLARSAWRPARAGDADRGPRAIAAITRLSHRLSRGERDCLQRSLVLFRELSRAGADPVLMMGFRRSATGVEGHAWVETPAARGRSVLPEDVSVYEVAMSFGEAGRLITTQAAAQR